MKLAKVGIILKQDSNESRQIGSEMVEWFAGRSVEAIIDQISEDMDLLVILGGDGTLLHVAHQAGRYKIPVVGINLGSLGFLTEVAVENRYEALEKIIAGSVAVEDRLMLKSRICRGDAGYSAWHYSLNDVVIS